MVWSTGGVTYSVYKTNDEKPWKAAIFVFAIGNGRLVAFKAWSTDLGTGAGLCSLLWTVGGGTLQVRRDPSEISTASWTGY